MATFSIKTPDGTFEVTAPDEESAMRAFQGFQGGESEEQGVLSGLVDSFTSGITGNFGDEITAAESALLGRKPGGGTFDLGNFEGTFGERFDAALAAERGQQERFSEENPVSSTVAQIAGAISPLAAAGIGAKTVGGAAALGAGEGALFGAGSAEGGVADRLIGAGVGAGTGAAGGAIGQKFVAPLVDKGIQAIAPAVGRAGAAVKNTVQSVFGNDAAATAATNRARSNRGVEFVLAKAKELGIEPNDLLKRLDRGEVIGQQDPGLARLTRAVNQNPNASSQKIIGSALQEGFGANQRKVTSQTRKLLGGQPNFTKWLNGFKKKEGEIANKAYEAAFSKPLAIPAGQALDLTDKLGRVPSSALRSAQQSAQISGKAFPSDLIVANEAGELVLRRVPNLREAEQIRRGLKSATTKAFREGDGDVGVALRELEQEFRSVIDKASPALKKTRARYADKFAIEEAAETGLSLLNKRSDVVEVIIEGASKQELKAIRNGVAADIEHRVERGQLNRDAIKTIFGSARNRKVIGSLFGGEKKAKQFFAQMERMAGFNALRSHVTGGSLTAERLADASDLESGGILESAVSAALGDFRPAARAVLIKSMKAADKAIRGRSPQELDAMAKILVGNSFEVRKLLSLASRGNQRAIVKLNEEVLRALPVALGGVAGAVAVQEGTGSSGGGSIQLGN